MQSTPHGQCCMACCAETTPTLDAVRDAIRENLAELRRIDRWLARLAALLPEASEDFDEGAEIRDTIETVQIDLLADAAETLSLAAEGSVEELRRRYRQRQEWHERAAV